MKDDNYVMVINDGNQRLEVIERDRRLAQSNSPKDFEKYAPRLTGEMLMGTRLVAPTDTRVSREIGALLSTKARAMWGGLILFKLFFDRDLLMIAHSIYLEGIANVGNFTRILKDTERPDSFLAGLSELELQWAWPPFRQKVEELGKMGYEMRKRKDWRG